MPTPVVLYAEDEENDVFFMKRAFRQINADLVLHTVADGPGVIAYLSGVGIHGDRTCFPLPDVLLLDINLPGCSGFEVLGWLRKQPQFESLPVVMFSSSARAEDKEKARVLGANSFLQKPASGLDFPEFAASVCRDWLTSE